MRATTIAATLTVLLAGAPVEAARNFQLKGQNELGGGIGFSAGLSDWSPGGFKWFNDYSHQLGKLVVLRETSDATVLRTRLDPTEEARALAAHWLHMAGVRMAPHFEELAPMAPIEAITEAFYARATPQ